LTLSADPVWKTSKKGILPGIMCTG